MTTTGINYEDPRVQALHKMMAENSLSGHWLHGTPAPELEPRAWPWKVIRDCLEESGEVVEVGEADSQAARRTVQLINPSLTERKSTSRTLQMSIQLVKPGEIAECHRHTAAALRFIVESTGAFTAVEGERMIMEPGDLVLTPNWTWHDHANNTQGPAVWLDVLDVPFVSHIGGMFAEPFGEGRSQPITKPDGYSQRRLGAIRSSVDRPSTNEALPFTYKWADALAAMGAMDEAGESSPYDGVLLEYTNPVTGGPTMPTIGCWAQMLRPGEKTEPHRHTGMTVYHTVSGEGVTTVGRGSDEKALGWGAHDCFFVPSWQWHWHENLSKSEPAFLFSVTDRPMLQAFNLFQEEKG
jgi:gentisate 1,2-dioxygenase